MEIQGIGRLRRIRGCSKLACWHTVEYMVCNYNLYEKKNYLSIYYPPAQEEIHLK